MILFINRFLPGFFFRPWQPDKNKAENECDENGADFRRWLSKAGGSGACAFTGCEKVADEKIIYSIADHIIEADLITMSTLYQENRNRTRAALKTHLFGKYIDEFPLLLKC